MPSYEQLFSGALVVGGVWWLGTAMLRANELFVLEVRAGRLSIVRGRLPARLFGEVEDIVARARIQQARIRVFSRQGHPAVSASSLPDHVLQRVRNVVCPCRVVDLRHGNLTRSSR